jgi:DNA-binding SARP family transcriptional activator
MTAKYDLNINLLGGFKVRINNKQIDESNFKSRKSITLFKLLALSPEYKTHRNNILDSLWSALDSFTAAAQLYKCVHYIRKAINLTIPSAPADQLVSYENEILSLNFTSIATDLKSFQNNARNAFSSNTLEDL